MGRRRATGRHNRRVCPPAESAPARNTRSASASQMTPTIWSGRIPRRTRLKARIPTRIPCRIYRLSRHLPRDLPPTVAVVSLSRCFHRRGLLPAALRPAFRSRALRWVALAVVVAIAGVMAYAWVTAQQNGSPIGAVTQFCSALRGDKNSQAYNLLASGTRNRVSYTQFATAGATLDRIEGRVTACPAISDNAVQIGVNSATVDASLTRAGLGPMRGKVGLAHEQNAWRISSLDPTLLGVSLDALVAANNFCAELQAQRYADTYTALTDDLRGGLTSAEYEQMSQWSDQIDGTVRSCAPVTVDSSAGESAATMSFSITRAKLGKRVGDIALVNDNGVWKAKSVASDTSGDRRRRAGERAPLLRRPGQQ